ncbi:MAG: hypothetical protein OXD30_00425 [Bryobacterales bacterium]|nr:hypothetical protein [Bryobacterales bacterium]
MRSKRIRDVAAANLIAQVMARLDARKSILVARNAKIDSLRSVPGAGLAALGLLVTFRLFDAVISRLERACKDFRNLWNALLEVSQGRAPNFQHQNRHGRLRLLVSHVLVRREHNVETVCGGRTQQVAVGHPRASHPLCGIDIGLRGNDSASR